MDQEKRKKYNLKQLNIEVPKYLMEEIKEKALQRNIPMRTLMLRAILYYLKDL